MAIELGKDNQISIYARSHDREVRPDQKMEQLLKLSAEGFI